MGVVVGVVEVEMGGVVGVAILRVLVGVPLVVVKVVGERVFVVFVVVVVEVERVLVLFVAATRANGPSTSSARQHHTLRPAALQPASS